MTKVLVTTDFSANSEAGIYFAIQLADQAPCELIFYNAIELSDTSVPTDHNYTDLSVLDSGARKEKLSKFVLDIYKQHDKKHGTVEFVIDNQSDVDASIIAYAEKCKADYICMSTRGGGIVDKFMGTNASSLITTSSIPLMVVPHTYRMNTIKLVLYASDLEKIDTELKAVKKFATTFNADITIYNYDYFIEEDEVKSKLKKISDKYSSDKITFHFEKLYAEVPMLNQLRDDISSSKPSIIAMFTKHDRSWYERLFLSSKTAEMGFDTKTPLLVFRK